MPILSIVIPVYNEAPYIRAILDRVVSCELPAGVGKEILVINDGSLDRTESEILSFISDHPLEIKYFTHPKNLGKGAAIKTGFHQATGSYVLIQDSDLEYNPKDYAALLEPMLQDLADVVYGSRFVSGKPHRVLFFWHSVGNRFLTFLSNMFTNLNLTDMETCYKVFRKEVIDKIRLKENRFGFEPEITARIARIPGIRIYEVGISYSGRTYKEGKKIKWKDGLWAIYCILRYNLFR